MGLTLDRLSSISIVDSGGDELAIDASGYITANINGTVTVSATNLDIRGLNVATDGDHLYITDSTGANALAVDASGHISINDGGNVISIDDAGGSITVDGTVSVAGGEADDAVASTNPLGVGGVVADVASALSEISAAGDRFHLLGDMYRRLMVRQAADVAWQTSTATVGTSAVELASTPLNGRFKVIVQNSGSSSIFVGEANTVTTSNGIEISKNSSMEFEFGEAMNIWAISGSAGQDVRVLEAA